MDTYTIARHFAQDVWLDGHETLAHFRAVFPDQHGPAERTVVNGDILGVLVMDMDVRRIANDKIAECWAENDLFGLLQQPDVTPSP